ncbi:MAG: molybdopterin-dependent oxidoreductase, partial [Candidatus Omnitrophica bacterium]|nr:molybdopterin-dependent oxidoreductase [Candidatus Omnitrophota bacterium]
HVTTCTNVQPPCGMGLWEGVPMREVIWRTKPVEKIRRAFYYGYHNDDPKQLFQSSLPIGRILEDPPGELPVILCYKLNGQWLSPVRGGPVRVLVPGGYGNKSVKWLQRIMLTNNPEQNDTYAEWNNDTVSHLKTLAAFIHVPESVKANTPIPITGLAQVGMSGLTKVQYWIHPSGEPLPEDDPYFTKGDWKDAEILPAPDDWGGDLPGGNLPPTPLQIDPTGGHPYEWPMRYTIAHWATLLKDIPPGEYTIRCRTIDAAGVAQPMPRPFRKSGNNQIQSAKILVQAV